MSSTPTITARRLLLGTRAASSDRSHFETVEFSLWYYGPWFQMLTAYLQSFDWADRITVRHAMTFRRRPRRAGGAAAARADCDRPLGRACRHRALPDDRVSLRQPVRHAYRRSISRRDDVGDARHRADDAPYAALMAGHRRCRSAHRPRRSPPAPAVSSPTLICLEPCSCASRNSGPGTDCGCVTFCRSARATRPSSPSPGPQRSRCGHGCQTGNPWAQFKVALVHFATIPMSYEFPVLGATAMDRCAALVLHPGSAVGAVAGRFSLPAGGGFHLRDGRRGGPRPADRDGLARRPPLPACGRRS